MNVLKSVVVFAALGALVTVAVHSVHKRITAHRNGAVATKQVVKTVSWCLVVILCVVLFGTYTYPFERPLQPVLIAEIDVPEVFPYDDFGSGYWVGVHSRCPHFDPDHPTGADKGVKWPELHVEKYSYVVTYCQKIDNLTYNIWDTTQSGAKAGHIVFDEEITENKVYVYQIPKMRIDNANWPYGR